ncbi:MAG: N-acylglucosamine 2-epimerase [Planctomycetes bacterium]|jgi:N-acylglucosamine 2-epimerase|nr:N-acylglucosamine 2-epimerase [Planctomycetota bacterium]
MTLDDLTPLLQRYRSDLVGETLPFWLEHGWDRQHGGIVTSLDRDGSRIDGDKSMWFQGRAAWMYATAYNTVEQNPQWLEFATSCLQFLEQHGFDDDGRMYFLVTEDGKPLRKRRYVYSEAFASMAYSACARATGNEQWAERSRKLFDQYTRISFEPGVMEPKVDAGTRPSKGCGALMICLQLAQLLRDNSGDASMNSWIDRCIEEIEQDFCKADLAVVMETVSPTGEIIDSFDGRLLNPGHAIEAAWFILHEAKHRGGDAHLVSLGVQMLDWMWKRGWDEEHGGLYSYRDLHELPVQEPGHDMKYWWPHTEAIIATLLAYQLTGDERHAERFQTVHDWSQQHFADPQHGEWYGYLHRDGTPALKLKGNHWKGPFHLPRMQWYASQLIEEEKR